MRHAVTVVSALVLLVTSQAIAKPVVVAHRGASGYLPENTLEAKAMAYGMGADYIEQDVVLTKDNVPVILHDIHLETVTDVKKKFPKRARVDGRYFAIDFTLAEIKSLNVTERFNKATGKAVFANRFPTWKSEFRVPTLAEEIELIQGLNKSTGKDVGVYVEIKAPAWHKQEGKDITKIVHDMLSKYGYPRKHKKIFLQCFDADTLKRLKHKIKSRIPLVQLIAENSWEMAPTDFDHLKTEKGIKEIATYASGVGPWLKQLYLGKDKAGKVQTSKMVEWAHKQGLKVHPFTLRADQLPKDLTLHEAQDVLFKTLKVDGVFTDFPDLTSAYVRGL